MSDAARHDGRNLLRYRILRYTPNLVRDEWINIGVLLEEAREGETAARRRAVRLIEDSTEMARVRRLHPAADEALLRALPAEFDARLRAPEADVRVYLEKLDQTLSNVLQLSPQRGLLAEDFDAELARVFQEHVAAPSAPRSGLIRNIRARIRARVRDVFYKRGLSKKIDTSVRVEEFTQPGDPLRLDYAYRYNGTRGYIQAVALGTDATQAKILAYTAECIRARAANSVFTAVTEVEPSPENPRQEFIARLFADQRIDLVSLNRIERFAEDLRQHLQ
jgi:Protein of unknown function (DUF3037)